MSQSTNRKTRATPSQGYGFGTFKGVYTPSILTILGVIMYLRFGWVLGNTGLPQTLIIVTLANIITFLTALSIAALATNMRVGGGGAYYMLSRSLGVEVGAAIGLPLFLSLGLSISFYAIGFSESLAWLFPALPVKPVAISTMVAVAILVFFSADLALRAQFAILALILLSLVSFFTGSTPAPVPAQDASSALPPVSFWGAFAVFFPAVTGILAGVSMSGDLKNPARSLPWGTLAAVVTSYAIYMAIPVFLNRKVTDKSILLTNPMIMRDVARFGFIIIAALWGATLSSAIGTLLGAPRILQALAKDGVIPRIVGKGFGPQNDPRIATAISFMVGLAGVLYGDLNAIAPIITMFFLTTYGLLNLSAAFEGLIGSPSWRPSFRVHWFVSLLGAFGCFFAMFMINAGATFVAAFISALVYYLMGRRSMKAHWGDPRYGILMLFARHAIYKLAGKKVDEKSWSPNILVLSGSPTTRWHLIELASAISHGKGLLTVASVLPEGIEKQQRVKKVGETIQEYLRKRDVVGLVKIHPAENVASGLRELVRSYGFGPIVPNTVLLGETEKAEALGDYSRLISLIHHTNRNLIIYHEADEWEKRVKDKKVPKRIDIWWGGKRQNAGLMLALAFLLTRSEEWEKSSLILKTVVDSEAEILERSQRLRPLAEKGRIEVSVEVILRNKAQGIFEAIQESSRAADLLFLGIRPPDKDEQEDHYKEYCQGLLSSIRAFPPTVLAMASREIEFHRVFQ